MSEFEAKWRDVEDILCPACETGYVVAGDWTCPQCGGWEGPADWWRDTPAPEIWLWLYGGLVPCGPCGQLYQSDDDPDYEGYCCPECRKTF